MTPTAPKARSPSTTANSTNAWNWANSKPNTQSHSFPRTANTNSCGIAPPKTSPCPSGSSRWSGRSEGPSWRSKWSSSPISRLLCWRRKSRSEFRPRWIRLECNSFVWKERPNIRLLRMLSFGSKYNINIIMGSSLISKMLWQFWWCLEFFLHCNSKHQETSYFYCILIKL